MKRFFYLTLSFLLGSLSISLDAHALFGVDEIEVPVAKLEEFKKAHDGYELSTQRLNTQFIRIDRNGKQIQESFNVREIVGTNAHCALALKVLNGKNNDGLIELKSGQVYFKNEIQSVVVCKEQIGRRYLRLGKEYLRSLTGQENPDIMSAPDVDGAAGGHKPPENGGSSSSENP